MYKVLVVPFNYTSLRLSTRLPKKAYARWACFLLYIIKREYISHANKKCKMHCINGHLIAVKLCYTKEEYLMCKIPAIPFKKLARINSCDAKYN